ncbi:MAG TPA: hypothetical protein PK266_03325 [Candidatus Saccharicenans sp.]|nr:hypothetical protein [Candidatus Saccharicenans sp.]
MPEKISLSRSIVKTAGLLAILTTLMSLFLVCFIYFSSSEKELLHLSGGDYLISRGLWLSLASLLFGLMSILTASGLTNRKNWSRLTLFLTAVILTLLVPIGTIFGLKLLFNFFSQEMKSWFNSGRHNSPGGTAGQQKLGIKLELLTDKVDRQRTNRSDS